MEALILKYTLGTCFVVITLVFGIKIILLLTTVAKIKLAATVASLQGTPFQALYDGFKLVFGSGVGK